MTIRNQHLKPLIEVSQIIKGNIQLKKDLPKSLMNVLAAQKNIKTLASKEKEFLDLIEAAKLEVAIKDEKGKAKIIVGENPKDRRYEIPEERQDELMVLINNMFNEEVEIKLSVFSAEAGEEIIKYLNNDQSTVFIEFLLEKEDEDEKEVVIKELEPTEA